VYEGFSKKDAAYAVSAIKPNWKAQAAKAAQTYLDYSSFSRQGLIEQLMYEGYTRAQAEYGVKKVGL
jgi:Host cell surface-exposed lipoprotein